TLDALPSFYLLAIRFTIGSVLLSLIFLPKYKKLDKGYIKGGCVMGVFLFMAYGLQTIGLNYTTPGKNAFLTAIYCLIVPFLYWAVAKIRPDGYNITAAVLCVFGIWLVSVNPSAEGMINIGDVLTMAGGFMYACHIIAVNKAAGGRDIILLTILQFITAAVLSWLTAFITEDFPAQISTEAVVSLAYLGVMATSVALLLQNIGQKFTPPSTAALLLSLEAVFGVVFSVAFADEQLTVQLVCGFALIFIALVISEVKPKFGRRAQNGDK
ncbi:MAG: DMT family transporter, partial [Clostridia bacterium]